MRTVLGMLCVPVLLVTGYRFSKHFRHARAGWRAFVYRNVDVVGANLRAGLK